MAQNLLARRTPRVSIDKADLKKPLPRMSGLTARLAAKRARRVFFEMRCDIMPKLLIAKRPAPRACLALAFAAAALAPPLSAQASDRGPARQETLLDTGWKFHLGESPGAEAAGFADNQWDTVTVPHSWNRVGNYTADAHRRLNTPQTLNTTQGVGWYRKAFTAPPALAGKRLWLQFDAASRTAEVWLNGTRLGAHAGGFSRFRFDATTAIRLGAVNTLVVKTNNAKPAPGTPTADVLPLGGDFFIHGGLYRPVTLIATDAVHFEMLDYGAPGVYAETVSVEDGAAVVRVRAKVRFDPIASPSSRRHGPKGVSLSVRLVDAGGATVAQHTAPVALEPGKALQVAQALRIPKARLWQGVEDPYLYRLIVELRNASGATLDQVDQAFGVRQIRIDPEQGFLLNGRRLELHGVGLHQDEEGKGWARSDADIAQDVAIIREMGANTIRLTHYQHGQTVHDLADRLGLILWDEIALVTVWTPPGQTQPTVALVDNAQQQLQELIRQNYNHASVATWGIANEVDMGNSLPAFISGVHPDADPLPLLHRLNALAKAEDTSRPVVQAACCEGRLYDASVKVPDVAPATELLGVNRYFGWYYGTVGDLDEDLERLRVKRPRQPLSVSEYGAGGAISIHTDNPLGGPVDFRGHDQPEEYQSLVHEKTWALLRQKPYLWATWLWNSFDFATTIRREGDAEDINTKGLVTYDRQIRKDAFFFYKANWNAAPTVHITGKRYVDRAYPVTDVRVYSNAPSTELRLNGRSLGSLQDCPLKVCVWKDVRLTSGSNTLSALGRFPAAEIVDGASWTLHPDHSAAIRIDSGALVAAPSTTARFGSDAFFSGGVASSVNAPTGYGRPTEVKPIEGAINPQNAATYREGAFSYRIPVTAGRYAVTLTFVEPGLAPTARVFDVIANGQTAIEKLDVAVAAGGPRKAIAMTIPAVAKAGVIDLNFVPRMGQAIVSSIEVEPR